MTRHTLALLWLCWALFCGDASKSGAVECDDMGWRFGGDAAGARGWSIEADTLLWWTRGTRLPALVTTSDAGTPRQQAGVLGLPSTSVLFGDETIGANVRSGVRLRITGNLDRDGLTSAHLRAFYLGSDGSGRHRHSGANTPILARPFFDSQAGAESSELVEFPNVVEGSVAVSGFSELFGGDLGLAREVYRTESNRIAVFSGYRFLRFREGLSIREDLESIENPSVIPLGTEFVVRDVFGTDARFHGATVGMRFDRSLHSWELSASASVSLGGTQRRLQAAGRSDVTTPGDATNTTPGGLLVLPSNMGTYRSTRFAAVPEWQVGVRRWLSDFASVGVGYDLILLPGVWRIGDQMDRTVNSSQLGGGALNGEARPAPRLASQTMWMQGLSFNLGLYW